MRTRLRGLSLQPSLTKTRAASSQFVPGSRRLMSLSIVRTHSSQVRFAVHGGRSAPHSASKLCLQLNVLAPASQSPLRKARASSSQDASGLRAWISLSTFLTHSSHVRFLFQDGWWPAAHSACGPTEAAGEDGETATDGAATTQQRRAHLEAVRAVKVRTKLVGSGLRHGGAERQQLEHDG